MQSRLERAESAAGPALLRGQVKLFRGLGLRLRACLWADRTARPESSRTVTATVMATVTVTVTGAGVQKQKRRLVERH